MTLSITSHEQWQIFVEKEYNKEHSNTDDSVDDNYEEIALKRLEEKENAKKG